MNYKGNSQKHTVHWYKEERDVRRVVKEIIFIKTKRVILEESNFFLYSM